jgi:hypothetical protein
MDKIWRTLSELVWDERGQGTVEYILILSASVLGAGQLARMIMKSFDSGISRLGGQLEKDLKTGRAPLGVWEN